MVARGEGACPALIALAGTHDPLSIFWLSPAAVEQPASAFRGMPLDAVHPLQRREMEDRLMLQHLHVLPRGFRQQGFGNEVQRQAG